ncbi:hypothetical protein F0562_001452 [Nyssa sinensis]|uniref:Uncharacterized protein n=1 Tax=Nyssa sinensis TaxID=561372 RepID=A0A5J5C6E2_9ASTE|nr:hypothetical protein F0562_001452 [Nyssa sinensis]
MLVMDQKLNESPTVHFTPMAEERKRIGGTGPELALGCSSVSMLVRWSHSFWELAKEARMNVTPVPSSSSKASWAGDHLVSHEDIRSTAGEQTVGQSLQTPTCFKGDSIPPCPLSLSLSQLLLLDANSFQSVKFNRSRDGTSGA